MSAITKSLRMCMFSYISYLHKSSAISYLNSADFGYVEWFTEGSAVAFVAYNKYSNELVICFRGTPKLDLQTILSYISTAHKRIAYKGYVHARFYTSFKLVDSNISAYIKSLPINEKTNIVCTGHSSGAALATIAAGELIAKELYTFGSPRVGDKEYVEYLNSLNILCYRYVNNNDIITSLPFSILGYSHFGKAIYFNHYGNIRHQNIWQEVKDRVRGSLRFLYKKEAYDSLFDHKIIKYYEKLENNVSTPSKNQLPFV